MTANRTSAPAWFWIAAAILLIWGVMGCYSCVQQFRLGADAMGPASDYDRGLYAALPVWYDALFAVSVGTGLLGVVALFARSVLAQPLFAISLIGMVIMFGWMFAMTDIIAVKGFAVAAGFPIVIAAIAVFQVWLAGLARRNGWIG